MLEGIAKDLIYFVYFYEAMLIILGVCFIVFVTLETIASFWQKKRINKGYCELIEENVNLKRQVKELTNATRQ